MKKNKKEKMLMEKNKNMNNFDKEMEEEPLKSVYFHFRFKFLALTTVFFLLYLVLSGASTMEEFISTPQFSLLGPYLIISIISFVVFRNFPIKCPECEKTMPTKKDWVCIGCGQKQGKPRCLADKCRHCKNMQGLSTCDHCGAQFRL
jgi:hypothetical protein